jgi:50S ribosomal protein L16 3-hydroxylase
LRRASIPTSIEEGRRGAVLREWLGDVPVEWFLDHHYQREPYVRANSAAAAVPLLGWDTVARLVERGADMYVVRNGALRAEAAPPTFAEARALFREGYSLVVRSCEEHDAGLRDLRRSFAAELGGEVWVQAFVTPAGFHSFGWHYDCEEVFIVQTGGIKEYFLRPNTVNPSPTRDRMPRDMQWGREDKSGPALAATLIAGDWLYIPRGFWHRAEAREDSLSLSVGILTPAARGAPGSVRRAGVHAR